MRRGWWSRHNLPRDLWDERDWKEHWRSQRYQALNKEPMQSRPVHTAPTWSLTSPDSEARSKRADRILKSFGIR